MPGLDGIGVLRALRRPASAAPSPSSSSPRSRPPTAPAPSTRSPRARSTSSPSPAPGESLERFIAELADKVARRRGLGAPPDRAPAGRAGRARRAAPPRPRRRAARAGPPRPGRRGRGAKPLVVIASLDRRPARRSRELVPQLPAPLGAGTVIVQHMPAGFTDLARRAPGPRLAAPRRRGRRAARRSRPTRPLLAPGGPHLRLDADAPRRALRRRSRSAACARAPTSRSTTPRRLYGRRLLLVVLTGMGNDGARGRRGGQRRRRPRPRRGRVDLHRLRHAARGGRGRPRRRGPRRSTTCPPRSSARLGRDASHAARSPHDPRSRRLRRLLRGDPRASAAIDLLQYKRGQMERRIRTFARRRGTPDLPKYARRAAPRPRRARRASSTA